VVFIKPVSFFHQKKKQIQDDRENALR